MKLLILSDAHGGRWQAKPLIELVEPDLIVIPGDLPGSIDFPVLVLSYIGGRRSNYVRNSYSRFHERLTFRQIRTAKRLLDEIVDYNIPILLIHGNTETRETRTWMKLYCDRYRNLHWISDDSVIIDDIQFVGHGWVGVPPNYDRIRTPGEIDEKDSEKILKKQIKLLNFDVDQSVLVSHAPPYGTSLDYLPHKRIHAGSKPIRKALNSRKLSVSISGHLHESLGVYIGKKWWGINAGAVIEDTACTVDLKTKEVIWYKNVVNKFGLSPFIYSKRTKVKYD
ncbi:MAG: metallophosphoesterase [Candidatus Heimdallarchaeota archaeon]